METQLLESSSNTTAEESGWAEAPEQAGHTGSGGFQLEGCASTVGRACVQEEEGG